MTDELLRELIKKKWAEPVLRALMKPGRYTELHRRVYDSPSGRSFSTTALTDVLDLLQAHGLVQHQDPTEAHSPYRLTAEGRQTLARLDSLDQP